MHEAFYIVGPTAVGKTGVAVDLAERHGAEIVSADAYQVYRGFDLLTAKPSPEQRQRVVHHLIDCLDPSESYNVARYLEDARVIIERAQQKGIPVIVVGGNGLYVKALTHGLSPMPEVQPALRTELESTPLPALLTRLRELDPLAYQRIDHRNARRVVRALEVCRTTGKPFSSFQTNWQRTSSTEAMRGVFLTRERDDLINRINERVGVMFARGILEEVQRDRSPALSATAQQILGLAEIEWHLAGRLSLADCQERIRIATRQYAKRQMTWFKREPCFETVHCPPGGSSSLALGIVDERFSAWRQRVSAGGNHRSEEAGRGTGLAIE